MLETSDTPWTRSNSAFVPKSLSVEPLPVGQFRLKQENNIQWPAPLYVQLKSVFLCEASGP